MTILYRPGKSHGNPDALSRIDTRYCPREDCSDNVHLIKKVSTPSENLGYYMQSKLEVRTVIMT